MEVMSLRGESAAITTLQDQHNWLFWFCFVLLFETGFLCVALEPIMELGLVNQAGLKLRELPASASRVLGLKACAITTQLTNIILN